MKTEHVYQLLAVLALSTFALSGCSTKQARLPDSAAVVPSPARTDAASEEPTFGPAIEVALSSDQEGRDYVLDLDTGRVLTPAREMELNRLWESRRLAFQTCAVAWQAYLPGLGADIVNEENLTGLRMCVMKLEALKDENGWVSLSAVECARRIEGLREDPNPLSGDHTIAWDRLPSTWLFQTHEGGRGIFQVIEIQRQPKRVKMRYKLLHKKEQGAASSGAPTWPLALELRGTVRFRHSLEGRVERAAGCSWTAASVGNSRGDFTSKKDLGLFGN